MGKDLPKDSIDSLISCNYSKISGHYDLELQVFNSAHVLGMIIGHDSLYALKFMEDAYKFIVKYRRTFKEKFSKDSLFGYKFAHALNQHFQRFLSACLDADSIADIDASFFDLSCIGQSVLHLKFSCELPSLFATSSSSDSSSKSSKTVDSLTETKKDSNRHIRNEFTRPEWTLSKSTKLTDVFSTKDQKSAPKFDDNNLCCVHWAAKAYCF